MVRTPCCEKLGLKRGPWTPQEDEVLTSYIARNGHGNWRSLPKLAGLLRCGKSCRLRWVNYLRPNIKRGNFTAEEEATIIKLHGELGNRWSLIAASLPGRTDNEIKNVWNTYLKKGLNTGSPPPSDQSEAKTVKCLEANSTAESSSEISTASSANSSAEADESFWSEVFSGDDFAGDLSAPRIYHGIGEFPYDLNMESGSDFWEGL